MKAATGFLTLGLLLSRALAGPETPSTFVDDDGVLRWTGSRQEVVQFGVNYTAPFAHAFRALHRLGVPVETAIDADVYHFARLGFDAYRVHLWDREISDPAGNLVVNDHVRAFDHLLASLKARGIKIILTPLQFSDAAYPEPPEPLDGFSKNYDKEGCLTKRESWPLQQRYLAQLLDHVNPHTGLAYKDDPDILAFEICNEPGHTEYTLALDYINTMAKAMRDTGCTKPIFYNMSHGLPVHEAYLDANVQGGTFQWYPSGLVAGHEQWGNFLPYVDDYPIPFGQEEKFRHKAKIIYEFDAADIGRSYLYPAMARTFRKAGFQFATQFAYDGLYLASVNTEYQTHYLNLAYTPQKALSMKIAAEAFRRIPRLHDYGVYPDDNRFEGVRVSYDDDLAELVTEENFFHSNRTSSRPPAPERLLHVAGYASSPVVDYPGQGAYFLDRLEPGVWRLEVMPDAIWVRDPFERASPQKQVARIAWNEWPMQIDLPDLGADFTAIGLNEGNRFHGRASGRVFGVRPGAYLLTRAGVTTKWRGDDKWENITLKEFVAPPASIDKTYVLHQPVGEVSAGVDLPVGATIVSPDPIEKVELIAILPVPPFDPTARPAQPGGAPRFDNGVRQFPMTRTAGFRYTAVVSGAQLRPGAIRYHIAVYGPDGHCTTFPSETKSSPADWDFYGQPWSGRIVGADAPVLLFDAATDTAQITAGNRWGRNEIVPSDRPGTSALAVMTRGLDQGEHDQSFRFYFKEKTRGRSAAIGAARRIVIYGRAAADKPRTVQVALVTADGFAYGATVPVGPAFGACAIPIADLKQVRSPNIPHGYPVFINFWSPAGRPTQLDLGRIESVLVSIGPGLTADEWRQTTGVQIERIWLE